MVYILWFNGINLNLEQFRVGTLLPWLRYLLLIVYLALLKYLIIAPCIQATLNNIATK
jgi:hypothetical protein